MTERLESRTRRSLLLGGRQPVLKVFDEKTYGRAANEDSRRRRNGGQASFAPALARAALRGPSPQAMGIRSSSASAR